MLKTSPIVVFMMAMSLFGLAACGTITISDPGQATQPAATAMPVGTAPAPAAAPSIAPTSNASSAVVAAVQSVILKANHEEEQAVASHDPSAMRDTSTASYYNQIAQDLNDMLNSGVTAIKLDNLNWGTITQQNATTVQATTAETWSTTFSDGSNLQETDTNVYSLVLQGSSWLVQQDQHPNSHTLQPPGGSGAPTPQTPRTPLAPAGPGQSPSNNWAGYAASGGPFTAVSGTWTVPNVNPGATGIDATWVGIGGVTSRDLIQAGTQAVVQSGQVTYSAWFETLPQASLTVPLTVSAGDTVSVSITQQPDGTWQIVMKNTTNAQTYQTSVTYDSSNSSAEWVEEAPATGHRVILPLDNFGTVTFSNASTVKGGKTLTITQAGGRPITMETPSQQPLAQPSALAANGAGFTVTRTNVAAPRTMPGGRSLP